MEVTSLDLALLQLPPNAIFYLANQARPADAYFFASLLPERNEYSYHIDQATMRIIPTMAGLVGMDSPYPPGGVISASVFTENTAKIANRVRLNESTIRKLQEIVMRLQLTDTPILPYLMNVLLHFTDKLIVQAHLDTMEFLRGQALVSGKLAWTYNGKTLDVDYGVPTQNFLPNRTGDDSYSGVTSMFWSDIRRLRVLLKNNVRAFIAHPDTVEQIRANSVGNRLETIGGDGQTTFEMRRLIGSIDRPSNDTSDLVTLYSYGLECSAIDPSDPTQTINIPFMPRGKILAVANNTGTNFTLGQGAVGQGATPIVENALGYTHIAPTTEGNGVPGRFAAVYRPERELWAVEGIGVTNGLPVIEAAYKIAVASSDTD